jgi:hypothetical protein
MRKLRRGVQPAATPYPRDGTDETPMQANACLSFTLTAVLKTLALHDRTPPVKIHFAMITHDRVPTRKLTAPLTRIHPESARCSVRLCAQCWGDFDRWYCFNGPIFGVEILPYVHAEAPQQYGPAGTTYRALGQACIKPMGDSPCARRYQPLCVQVPVPPTIALRCGTLRYRYIQLPTFGPLSALPGE